MAQVLVYCPSPAVSRSDMSEGEGRGVMPASEVTPLTVLTDGPMAADGTRSAEPVRSSVVSTEHDAASNEDVTHTAP